MSSLDIQESALLASSAFLKYFRKYEGNVENLFLATSESVDAYDRYVTVMRRINESMYQHFFRIVLSPSMLSLCRMAEGLFTFRDH